MRIDEFMARLKGVTPTGEGSWVACCPSHGDEHPSMSVTSQGGKILVHCHAGCTAQDIVDAMGLKMSDLFEDSKVSFAPVSRDFTSDHGAHERAALAPAKKKSGSHGKWVCDYVYHDSDGNVLYKASRFVLPSGKKSFQIKHRDGSAPGGWAYGLKDAGLPRVIYHLPEVIRAAKAHGVVVIAEGEKDVDNIRALGFTATCNVGGAGKWGYCFPDDWPTWFKGLRGVLIIADNDPETKTVEKYNRKTRRRDKVQIPFMVGQNHAWSVAESLRNAGFEGELKLMVMPRVGDVQPKDFTDWADACRAAGIEDVKAAFQAAVKDAAPWPSEWCFTAENADGEVKLEGEEPVARAEKGARDAESTLPDEDGTDAGRFGRWRPRAPGDDRDVYEVSFDVGAGLKVRLEFDRGMTIAEMTARAIYTTSQKCPGGDLPKGVAPRLKSWAAAIWLLMRGSFYWDLDCRTFARCMFLDRAEDSCKLMMLESDEFYAFLADAARLDDVDPKKGDLGKIMGVVKQIAISDEYSTGVTPSNMWDRRGNTVYVSSGDTQMYRLMGGSVELVQNGTDGVVFLRGKTLAPWKLLDGDGVDPFAEALVFKGASWEDAKHGPIVVRAWVLNLFACSPTKPPLLITGAAGSGKTRMAKAVKEILGVQTDGQLDMSVQQMEDGDKGLDAFWAAVNDGRLEVFDNLDTRIKWASDTLQIAATDGQTKRRTLYTTYGVSILKARAFLIFTSNNPIISTEGNGGMADRLVAVRLVRNRSKSMDRALSEDIASHRDEFLTWMARTVAKALADTVPVEDAVNTRHPDFGEFAVRCGRACGMEGDFVEALGAVEVDKLLLPLQNDVIMREVLGVLGEHGWALKFTCGDMAKAIIQRMGDEVDERSASIYSARKIGKALAKYSGQLGKLLRLDGPKKIGGYPTYEVRGQRVSFMAMGSLGSLGVDFPESAGEERAQEFSENAPANSPNSPTRAGALDFSSSREERREIEEESEMEGEDGLVF